MRFTASHTFLKSNRSIFSAPLARFSGELLLFNFADLALLAIAHKTRSTPESYNFVFDNLLSF